jgi:hypothetical protein
VETLEEGDPAKAPPIPETRPGRAAHISRLSDSKIVTLGDASPTARAYGSSTGLGLGARGCDSPRWSIDRLKATGASPSEAGGWCVRLSKDVTYEVRCSRPGCPSAEQLPYYLVDKPEDFTRQWLVGRAWRTWEGPDFLCPEHW